FPDFGQPDPTDGKADSEVSDAVMKLLHSNGLHEQFLGALIDVTGALPPVLDTALTSVALSGSPTYSGPRGIDLIDASATP
ncbi:MAG: hypothetical protein ACYC1E_16605, partial [Propionibacteriaceae bacterium]